MFNSGHPQDDTGRKFRLSEIQENQNSYDLQISESERVSVDPISSKTKELDDQKKYPKSNNFNCQRKLKTLGTSNT